MRPRPSLLLNLTLMFALGYALAADLVFINLADTHSAYRNYPVLAEGIREVVTAHEGTPTYILVNGDVFELGNVVASRSAGEVDWAFLATLSTLAPVVLNIGNHEFDFVDPQAFMAEAARYGVTVIGSVIDRSTKRLLAPTVTTLRVDGRTIDLVGLATDQRNTYAADSRDAVLLPDPVAWARYYALFTVASDHSVLLSHAGVVADRDILAALPDNVLFVVGGHDHLVLQEEVAGQTYIHNGFRAERFNVGEVSFTPQGATVTLSNVTLADIAGRDTALEARAEEARAQTLTAEDLAAIGTVDSDYSVLEAAQWAVETLREAQGADVAMLNHTSFGAGLAAGELSRYAFDQFLRFDNEVMRARVDGETLAQVLALANQDERTPLAERTGDFVYATAVTPQPDEVYTVVTSSWIALPFNVEGYLGTSEIVFEQVPDVTVKGILAEALAR